MYLCVRKLVGVCLISIPNEKMSCVCACDVHPPIYSLGQFSETFEWTEQAVNFL